MIDMNKWQNYGHLDTNSLWLMQREDSRKITYPGTNIPNIQRQLFERFHDPKKVIVDPFLGSGTSAMVAQEFGYALVGSDLQKPDFYKEYYPADNAVVHNNFSYVQGNAADWNTWEEICRWVTGFYNSAIDFIFLHPPYFNIINYAREVGVDKSADMSSVKNLDRFMDMFRVSSYYALNALEPGGHLALLMGDIYQDSRVVPLGFKCLQALQAWPFGEVLLKGIVIKDINGNEAKGKQSQLWRYRYLQNGIFNLGHEYIFLFRKIN